MVEITEIDSSVAGTTRGRPRATESTTGITVVRGGNLLGTGLFQSIQDAYTNLNQNGFVIVYLGILGFASIAEFSKTTGPLELMKDALDAIVKDKKDHSLLINLAILLSKLLGFMIANKFRFMALGWMWFPYFAKPSSKNFWVSLFLSLFAIFSVSLDIWEIFFISQAYYLWAALRNPTHKMIALIVGVFLLIIALDVNFHTSPPDHVPPSKRDTYGSGNLRKNMSGGHSPPVPSDASVRNKTSP
uniref:Uncharacterized protein n=1 Tax=Xiangshan martelli-like virus 4 TaxID=2886235 RepID=A0A8K1YQR5_9VIRU|nr:MAG: hypothetical protein [Xiangshan martelli-like virus 4]